MATPPPELVVLSSEEAERYESRGLDAACEQGR